MNVALVGCGLIGHKRAAALSADPQSKLLIVADVDAARAEQLAREYDCQATNDWEQAVNHPQVEAVIVSTINKFLMPITVAALERGKHVMVEKPMARNLVEAEQVLRATRRQEPALSLSKGDGANAPTLPRSLSPRLPVLAVGFNHRHHPAIWKAHELCASGAIGPLLFIRCTYGHGGRPGYDKEWRADPDLAGGGELLDQGVHVVDLCRWFLGDFAQVFGSTATYFWNLGYFDNASSKHPSTLRRSAREEAGSGQQSIIRNPKSEIRNRLEDNAFALLRTASGQVAILHTSWTQWKNRFTFEVTGRDGYVMVEGLGGSYGTECLRVGRRNAQGGAPEEKIIEFPGPDLSWQAEWQEFTMAIREQREPLANGEDGLQAMRLIDAIYQSAKNGCVVHLE